MSYGALMELMRAICGKRGNEMVALNQVGSQFMPCTNKCEFTQRHSTIKYDYRRRYDPSEGTPSHNGGLPSAVLSSYDLRSYVEPDNSQPVLPPYCYSRYNSSKANCRHFQLHPLCPYGPSPPSYPADAFSRSTPSSRSKDLLSSYTLLPP